MNDAQSSSAERPSSTLITLRALQLRCPKCGKGKLYSRLFKMNFQCDHCGFRFQRGPGYYLGSIYFNYGLTTLIVTASYILGRFLLKIPSQQLLWGLLPFCVIFPLMIFRHSRALWLALDCRFDPSVLEEKSGAAEDASRW